jgi:SOS-response transcriptional repressor LexA
MPTVDGSKRLLVTVRPSLNNWRLLQPLRAQCSSHAWNQLHPWPHGVQLNGHYNLAIVSLSHLCFPQKRQNRLENHSMTNSIDNDAKVVKRKRISKLNWSRAIASAMASSKDCRTQLALAKKSGVAQSTIGRILRGEVNPQSANLESISRALGLTLAQLAELGQDGTPNPEPLEDLSSTERSDYVPLISWTQVSALESAIQTLRAEDAKDWMPKPNDSSDRTFALPVIGEAMEPGYQHGDILFVDPDIEPTDGRDVLVRFEEHDDVVLRRVMHEGRSRYLKPINPSLPGKVIETATDSSARILGVVVGKWVKK